MYPEPEIDRNEMKLEIVTSTVQLDQGYWMIHSSLVLAEVWADSLATLLAIT